MPDFEKLIRSGDYDAAEELVKEAEKHIEMYNGSKSRDKGMPYAAFAIAEGIAQNEAPQMAVALSLLIERAKTSANMVMRKRHVGGFKYYNGKCDHCGSSICEEIDHPAELEMPYCGGCGMIVFDATQKYCGFCGIRFNDAEAEAQKGGVG